MKRYCGKTNRTAAYMKEMRKHVTTALAQERSGRTRVRCDCGRAGIITESSIIEVHHYSDWMAAAGELMVHGDSFPGKKQVMNLFGDEYEGASAIATAKCVKRSGRYVVELELHDSRSTRRVEL
jgi:hypothetical protein